MKVTETSLYTHPYAQPVVYSNNITGVEPVLSWRTVRACRTTSTRCDSRTVRIDKEEPIKTDKSGRTSPGIPGCPDSLAAAKRLLAATVLR
jgi:hypothetical protein